MPGDSTAARVKRILRSAAMAIVATLLLLPPAAVAQPEPQRIVAVGDLHGDYQAWTDIARDAGLINAAGRWTGGKTVVVQLGDITDRGSDSLKIIRSLQQLQKEAAAAGGRVIVVLGNHEAMNVIGDYRYVHPGELAAFADENSPERRDRIYALNRAKIEAAARAADPKLSAQQIRDAWIAQHPLGWVEHRAAWGPAGELGKWAARNPAIVKIDDTLFAHGGISREYSRLPLDQVNRRAALAMATGVGGANSILDDPLGPLWYRGLVMRFADAEAVRAGNHPSVPRLTPEQELATVLRVYGARRLVVGHTPSLKGIQLSPDGRLARVDTGISRHYGGPLTWLEISGDKMVPHTVQRSAP